MGNHWDPNYYYNPGSPYCPQYEGLKVSDWEMVDSPRGSGYFLQAIFPGVTPRERQVQLTEDRTQLYVRGIRPVQTRRACLPRTARVSADGRSELIEVVVPLPANVDVGAMKLLRTRNGLEVFLPTMPHERPVPGSNADTLVPQSTPSRINTRARPTQIQRPVIKLPPSDGLEVIAEEYDELPKKPDACSGWTDNRGEFHLYGE